MCYSSKKYGDERGEYRTVQEYLELTELLAEIERHPISLLFIKTANCGVCDVTYARTVERLKQFPQVKSMVVSMEKIPTLSGEYLVFTAPAILLFVDGKEVFRQARFVSFEELERVLTSITC
nr:thioredoxin family protein [Brevibacillus sp. HB1.2]